GTLGPSRFGSDLRAPELVRTTRRRHREVTAIQRASAFLPTVCFTTGCARDSLMDGTTVCPTLFRCAASRPHTASTDAARRLRRGVAWLRNRRAAVRTRCARRFSAGQTYA